MLDNILLGFSASLAPLNLLYCLIGVTLGTVVGVLPGLGPVSSIALLLPVTYKMDLLSAVIMLSGIYYGVQYGGTITSVLMKIPGEASSVVTCIDGYEMAKKGKAGAALGIAAFGSFIAGTLGIIILMFLAPPLAKLALMMGPPEYMALMIAGLSLVIYLSSKSMIKSLMMGILGLLLGTIGMDPISGQIRFGMGIKNLMDGVDLAPMAMGLFGLAEVFSLIESKEGSSEFLKAKTKLREILPNRKDWRDSFFPITRGSIFGFLMGILPGGGAVMASFVSYAMERRLSKHPDKFGTGAIEGVAGPESSNNSAAIGAFVPLLTLGIPANVVMALLIGAFMIHGVNPGPLLLRDNPVLFWGIITSMYIGNLLLLIQNVPLIGLFVKILKVPSKIMAPLITVICFIGAYSINNNISGILVVIIFGTMGYLMRKFRYDPAPLILAFVLGPLLEDAFRQTMMLFRGDVSKIFERSIAMVFLGVAFFLFISPFITKFFKRNYSKPTFIDDKR
ncbi:MAG: tripartite tricarboxylate transporter permease [Deltaproteobacteria bacterium]|nr:tripartite tricarboxylate transporter permease [Deltaproteobacteria bacterium]